MDEGPNGGASSPKLWKVVRLVACLNLAFFGIEFVVASAIGSVSLFADIAIVVAGLLTGIQHGPT
jgi:Co/Zn/Cd efflux system component